LPAGVLPTIENFDATQEISAAGNAKIPHTAAKGESGRRAATEINHVHTSP
jgi:hypothetical protein